MSLTPNGSSVLQRFECSCALEIRNGIMFDFYPGLSHVCHVTYIILPPAECSFEEYIIHELQIQVSKPVENTSNPEGRYTNVCM